MNELRRNVMVGLFLLVGVCALTWLVIMFGGIVGRDTYPVAVNFDNVDNLIRGDQVFMRGVSVGKVSSIGFSSKDHPEQGVEVVLDITSKWRIPRSARVKIEMSAVGFERPRVKIVVTKDPSDGYLPTDGTAKMQGEMVSAFDSLLPPDMVNTLKKASRQIGDLAEAMTPLMSDLDKLIQPRELELVDNPRVGTRRISANLNTAVQRLDLALKHFNDVLGDPNSKSNLRIAVANIREISETGKQAMNDIKEVAKNAKFAAQDAREVTGKIGKIVDKAGTQFDDVTRTIITDAEKLGKFFDQMNVVGAKLAKGEGTAGKFLDDPELYDSMVVTMKRLQLAIDDLGSLVKTWKREGMDVKGVGLMK